MMLWTSKGSVGLCTVMLWSSKGSVGCVHCNDVD